MLDWLRQQNADIVVLQEVSRAWFAPMGTALGDLYPFQHQRPTERGARGNLLFSRFPFDSEPSTLDSRLPFESLVVNVDGHPLTVYNVSLATPLAAQTTDYSLPDLILRYDDQLRNRQIEQLLQQLETVTTPYLVAGDFNMSNQMSVYETLADRMGDSFREVGVGLGATWPAHAVTNLLRLQLPLLRIDYIWHSRAFQPNSAEVGPFLGSDHLPLKVMFNLPDGQF